MRARGLDRDAGSAVVDFALVGSLLTVLFAAVVQLGLALYVHNMLVSCAAEGARYAARADRQASDAVPATKELVVQTLNASYAGDVTVNEETVGGVRTVVVRIRAPVPLFGFLGPSRAMQVTGHAFSERQ
ncbi:MAG: TadE/TadG family type IV pilus assembly protein [Actinomycetales bacterium]